MKIRKITIVSLSKGLLGEAFVSHEVEIGLRRLEERGIEVRFSKNACKGLDFIKNHPEERANDLLEALQDDSDMVLCAIGGDDSYRLLPFLFDDRKLEKAASDKVFLGFSDTTMNHFMLHKVGMRTFYGQAFLPDVCEIGSDMLPYSKSYFDQLLSCGTITEIRASDVWYSSRQDFSTAAVGTSLAEHEDEGFVLLQGPSNFSGPVLGGCIDTIFDMFNGDRYADSPALCAKYGLFPSLDDWRGRILLFETSEEDATPEKYRRMLEAIKGTGVFGVISGILCGKPVDCHNVREYREIITDVVGNPNLPIVANVNIGHAQPRCIIPFGITAHVNVPGQIITFA